MKVTQKRKFLPVGHGAFFIERLFVDDKRIFTAVYDCGDSNNGNLVKQFVSSEFSPNSAPAEKIDILFISHFDKDHVNGLKFLQPYLTNRTRVFLPFYYHTLKSVYDRNKRVGIATVLSVLSRVHIRPILVKYHKLGEPLPDIDIDQHDFGRNGNVIDSGQTIKKIVMGKPVWRYVPFNLFNEEALYVDFQKGVTKTLKWNLSRLAEADKWSDQEISDLRGLYSSFSSLTINDNSLIVLSDRYMEKLPIVLNNQAPYLQKCGGFPFVFTRYAYLSCLYTGDTVLKRGTKKGSKYCDRYEAFLDELHRYTYNLALMQVPHHGSGNNINMATLCDSFSLGLFCNYGPKDPTHKVFFLKPRNMSSVWKTVIGVTDQPNSLFEKKLSFTV